MSRINPGSLSETYRVVAADQVDFDELYAKNLPILVYGALVT